jgi:SAM-dependent methyltransferase
MISGAFDLVGTPSQWVVKHAAFIHKGGRVLDLACGSGRHAIWLAGQGYQVDAVDRDDQAVAAMQGMPNISVSVTDIETGHWPQTGQRYDGIVVSRYLFRPLLKTLAAMLNSDEVLIYETFMLGNECYGRPSNPDYLLQPDELHLVYAPLLKIHAFEQGKVDNPVPAMMQRICAINSQTQASI